MTLLQEAGVVQLARATLRDVDFRAATFGQLFGAGSRFEACDFREMRLDGKLRALFSTSVQTVFMDCRFDSADFRLVEPGQSRFERCTFDGARFEYFTSMCAEFVDCHFSGSILHSRFYGRPHGPYKGALDPARTQNEFHGNDFSQVELTETTFIMGIPFAKQRWPGEPTYIRLDRIHQRLQRARLNVMEWSDLEARGEGLRMLRALSATFGDQNDLVHRREDVGLPASVPVQQRVWEVLTTSI